MTTPTNNEKVVTIDASTEKLEEFFDSCWEAGMDETQVHEFLKRRYMPLPWQREFHAAAREADKPDGPVDIGAGGARGPGKSHAVFAQCTLDDCRRIKGLKGLFLRQTGKAAAESFEDLVDKVLRGRENFKYNPSKGVLEFPDSGSRMLLGGFETAGDIDKYIGIEYDFIAVEELNQLIQIKIDKLKGSLRTSKPNWRPRMYTSFNPGGKGHTMVKTNYVDPYHNRTEDKTRFIPSTYKDNPFLNKEYIDYLEDLPGELGRAWREGDFDLFEGQFFSMWRRDKHVRPTRPMPQGFRKFLGIDHGKRAPFAAYWIAKDWDGNYWCVSPETKILTGDLRWVEAGTLKKGDKLAGFDENVPKKGKRRWKESVVEAKKCIIQPSYRLTFSDGYSIICSKNHQWLIEEAGRRKKWKTTKEIKSTDKFLRVSDTWNTDYSYDSGYLAGVFDGEGSYGQNNHGTSVLSLSQKNNELLKYTLKELECRQIRFGIYNKHSSDVSKIEITRKKDQIRLLGSTRPKRLLPKFSFNKFGGFEAIAYPTIVKREFLGNMPVVAMQTSTRTYIAEGLASHNCYREYYSHRPDKNEQGKEAEDNAKAVVKMTPVDEHIEMAVADKSVFHKLGYGESIGDILRRNGIGVPGTRIPSLEPSLAGRKIREARAQLLSQKLDWSNGKSPSIFVMECCPNLIRTIPTLQFDKNNPEDVDTDNEDHAYDALTYILQKLEDVQAKMPPQTNIEKKLAVMREQAEHEKNPISGTRFNRGI